MKNFAKFSHYRMINITTKICDGKNDIFVCINAKKYFAWHILHVKTRNVKRQLRYGDF